MSLIFNCSFSLAGNKCANVNFSESIIHQRILRVSANDIYTSVCLPVVASRHFTQLFISFQSVTERKLKLRANKLLPSRTTPLAAEKKRRAGGREKLSQKLFEKYVGGVQQNTHKCTCQAPLFPSRHRVN